MRRLLFCLGAISLFFVGSTLCRAEDKNGSKLRVAFLGNSITKHGPSEKIGWSGNWGMAASELSKDYVHLVLSGLEKQLGYLPEALIENISRFERSLDLAASADLVSKVRRFEPQVVVLAIGENVAQLSTPEQQAKFETAVTELLMALQKEKNAKILVRSCFWANPAKDEALKRCAEKTGAVFVDIRSLADDEKNYARSERDFSNEGVARHPGDRGMAAIADALLKVWK